MVFDCILIRIFAPIFINKIRFLTKEIFINFCGRIILSDSDLEYYHHQSYEYWQVLRRYQDQSSRYEFSQMLKFSCESLNFIIGQQIVSVSCLKARGIFHSFSRQCLLVTQG